MQVPLPVMNPRGQPQGRGGKGLWTDLAGILSEVVESTDTPFPDYVKPGSQLLLEYLVTLLVANNLLLSLLEQLGGCLLWIWKDNVGQGGLLGGTPSGFHTVCAHRHPLRAAALVPTGHWREGDPTWTWGEEEVSIKTKTREGRTDQDWKRQGLTSLRNQTKHRSL